MSLVESILKKNIKKLTSVKKDLSTKYFLACYLMADTNRTRLGRLSISSYVFSDFTAGFLCFKKAGLENGTHQINQPLVIFDQSSS